jgi:hypothetical protein
MPKDQTALLAISGWLFTVSGLLCVPYALLSLSVADLVLAAALIWIGYRVRQGVRRNGTEPPSQPSDSPGQ